MKNKLLIWGILGFSFLVLSFVYIYSRSNLSVITSPLQDNVFTQKVSDEFTKGEKITGEFSPNQDYLGQVLVRFATYNRINKDSLTFRLKEEGSSGWYYEHTYKTDQFLPDNLFTFGFPIIADSKGKTFDFEIESVDGSPEESVTLSAVDPPAALSFQYPKTLLVKNPILAAEFMQNKFANLVIDRELVIQFLIYLNFIALVLILEHLFLQELIKSKFKFRLDSRVIISLSLILMLASAIALYLKKPDLSLNLTIASYFLLVFGVIYSLVEAKRSKS